MLLHRNLGLRNLCLRMCLRSLCRGLRDALRRRVGHCELQQRAALRALRAQCWLSTCLRFCHEHGLLWLILLLLHVLVVWRFLSVARFVVLRDEGVELVVVEAGDREGDVL